MSSGTPYEPSRVRKMLTDLAGRLTRSAVNTDNMPAAMDRIKRLGMSPRTQELNDLWAIYRTEQYSGRKFDWNGQPATTTIDSDAIASAGFLPPGFYDAGATFPLKFRQPTAPCHLVPTIVDRFTSMLFSESNHPQFAVEGDPDAEDYIHEICESSRLWSACVQARTHGGAMGACCVGFAFIDGRPVIEVYDPRWVAPKFRDRTMRELLKIEIRHMYEEEERDESGVYVNTAYWYRRTIDETSDTLYLPAPVGYGEEPEWIVDRQVEHGFGFCPVVWTQNNPLQDSLDGDPDCQRAYKNIEAMDAILAQGHTGVLSNCDPTLVISSDAELDSISKGSGNAIKLPNGDAHYLEIAGSGPDAAVKMWQLYRTMSLESTQCVLDQGGSEVQKTAEEIRKSYSSMIARADGFREQYGQRLVLPLMSKIMRAVDRLAKGKLNADGDIERQVLALNPKAVKRADGDGYDFVERQPGVSRAFSLKWPKYFEIPVGDTQVAVQAASGALNSGLIDREHAIKFVSEFFRVEDVRGLAAKIEAEIEAQQAQQSQQMQGYMAGEQ